MNVKNTLHFQIGNILILWLWSLLEKQKYYMVLEGCKLVEPLPSRFNEKIFNNQWTYIQISYIIWRKNIEWKEIDLKICRAPSSLPIHIMGVPEERWKIEGRYTIWWNNGPNFQNLIVDIIQQLQEA